MTFDELEDDFLRITADVVWCTMATVDTRGRPRTRIVHPYWEVVDGGPVGWLGTSQSPLKTRHLAANPHVSLSYWSPKHETVYADCRSEWAPDERERVWQLYVDAEPPLGYDPSTMPPWKDGPLGGGFAVLRFEPWRVAVLTAADAAAGRFYDRVWKA